MIRPLLERRRTLSVWGLAVLLLFFCLGSNGLLEDNEARFFEISWEMQRSGDWLTPRLNFLPHFHKPPGTFWLVGASLRTLGASEWAGRLPVALAALGTLWLTWSWACSEGNQRDADRAVLVLVTSVEFWFLSRLVLTDMFLTASVTAALFCAWRSRKTPKSAYWAGLWVALGASALFKGPVGLAIVVPVLVLFYCSDPGRLSWNLRPRLGVPLFLAVAAPCYILACWRHAGLLGYLLSDQTAQRMLTTVHGRQGPWWFYLPVILAGFFPWSTQLGRTVAQALRNGGELDRLLLLWIGFPLLFFSCSGSKLPTYLLPIFPALALLTARSCRAPGALRRAGRVAMITLTLLAAAVAAYLQLGAAPEIRPATGQLVALATLISVVNLIAWATAEQQDDERWFAIPGWTFAACLLLLASALAPCDAAYSARKVARLVRAQLPLGGEVVEVADHLHGLPYYLERRLTHVSYHRETQFESPERYRSFVFPDLPAYYAQRRGTTPTLIVLRRSDYETFADPRWPAIDAGPWILLRVEGAAPEGEARTGPAIGAPSGPFGGGARLQRGG